MSTSRRKGTITIEPRIDPLTPGDVDSIDLREVKAGPANKRRYLRKFVPFRAAVVDSYSESVRLEAQVNGRGYDPIPENTARTFDSIAINSISIKNPSGSGANVVASDVPIILFSPEEPPDPPRFNPLTIIPGVE